jgi:hypothetical protein
VENFATSSCQWWQTDDRGCVGGYWPAVVCLECVLYNINKHWHLHSHTVLLNHHFINTIHNKNMFQHFECHHHAVTAIVTSLQKFVNCIVIARRHNDVQVMRVTIVKTTYERLCWKHTRTYWHKGQLNLVLRNCILRSRFDKHDLFYASLCFLFMSCIKLPNRCLTLWRRNFLLNFSTPSI